jgi:phenylalanine ammonia-lyase
MGLKGLQLSANSIMPLLGFLGNSIADRYPTHAEQFNQNINSQGLNSANLARQSITAFQKYMAMALATRDTPALRADRVKESRRR